MKYRICRRYSPYAGTWYVVQKRRLFWWKTLPFAFKELDMANQFIAIKEQVESICQSPLTYNSQLRQFEEIYRVQQTKLIKIKT